MGAQITAALAAFISTFLLVRRASKTKRQVACGSHCRPKFDRAIALALLPPLAAVTCFAATDFSRFTIQAILVIFLGAFLFWRCLDIACYEIRVLGDGILIRTALRQRFIKFEQIGGYYKDPKSIMLTLNSRQKVLFCQSILGFDIVVAMRCARRIRLRNPIVGFDDLHRAIVRARFLEPDEAPQRNNC